MHEAIDDRLTLRTRRAGHDIGITFFGGQCQCGCAIGHQVQPQQLDGCKRGVLGDEGAQEDHQDFSHVAGKQVVDELADVAVDDASLFHGGNDAGIVVIREHHIGSLLGLVGSGDAHGHTDIGALDGRSIVDAVTSHGHHLIVSLQGIHDTHLVLRGDAGEHGRILDDPP